MSATALSLVLRRGVLVGTLLCGFALVRAASPAIPEEAPAVTPLRGLAYTREDILEVRRQVRDRGANAALVADILKTADEWMARDEAGIAALVPPPGSLFAYGSAGDPKTNQAWPRFARSDAMCDFARPGEVRSPHTGDYYGAQKPGETYHDDGRGWTRESDGQVFYFKGVWNAWVVDRLHDAVDNLALAHLLTGRADHADRALLILDHLATLRIQLPTTGNSVADWPHAPTDEAKGFFHYMGNIANQRAINTAFAFDLVGNSPLATSASSTAAGLTVRENISKNYFAIYERVYIDRFRSLTNHGIILVANLVTQGVLFGDAAMLREGLGGVRGFFDNTINRDGDYMEVSGSYGRLGRDYGSRLLAPLANYSPSAYPAGPAMPALDGGLRPGDDPRWYETSVRMLYRLPVLGRYPQYGDMNMDRSILLDQDNDWLAKHRAMFLRILHRQTSRPDWKREMETLYQRAARQKQAPLILEDILLHGLSLWVEPPAPPADSPAVAAPGEASDLMPAKGIAILRGGEKKNARALFIRGGFNSWHGHDDQMTLVPYGHGMVLFGEFGYRWSGTPDNLGWGTRTIAHNTVVVNEDLPAPYLYKGFSANIPAPSASVTGFIADPHSPAQLVEMHNPGFFARAALTDYRRAAWLVDIDATRYYFVDIFHVLGGRTHDYAWNAPYPDAKAAPFAVEGVSPAPQPGVWTLASLGNAKLRGEPWNQPGQSWGERLNGENGLVTALPGEKRLPVSKWNPAPGNGYGMIWDVKLAKTAADWRATWPLPDGKHSLRAHLLNYDGMSAVTGLSPSMKPEHNFRVVVARREGRNLQSRFVNVVEVGSPGRWSVATVDKLAPDAARPADAAALRVNIQGGGADYLLSSRTPQVVSAGGIQLDGRQAFVRIDARGALSHLALQEASRLQAAGWTVEASAPALVATVLAVRPGAAESRVLLDQALPAGVVLAGAPLFADAAPGSKPAYSNQEYYSIEEIEPAASGRSTLLFRKQSLVTASLELEELDTATAKARLYWDHTLAGKPGTLAYRGHGVVAAGGSASTSDPVLSLISRISGRDVEFTGAARLSAGRRLDVLAIKPGDRVTLPLTVTLGAVAGRDDLWRVRSTQPLRLTLPSALGGRRIEVPAGETVFGRDGIHPAPANRL